MQQDADEYYIALMSALRNQIKTSIDESVEPKDLIEQLFEIEMEATTKNSEVPEEPVAVTKEKVFKLSCYIENASTPINHM